MNRPPSPRRAGLVRRAAALAALCALGSAGCGAGSGGATASTATSTLPRPSTSTSSPTTTGAASVTTTLPATTTTVAEAATTAPTTAAPTTTAASSTTTTSTGVPQWWRPVDAERPLQVWVLGDSLAETVGAALGRWGAATDWALITLDYEKGSGLVRPDAFDWPGAAEEGLAERGPEAVVVILGANDGQALRPAGDWLPFGTPEWDAEYARRVGAFMDLLVGSAARVYWVGVPIMADPEYDARVRHINALQKAEADTRPGVVHLDAYSLLQGEGGGFAWELPDGQGHLVEVRLPDGVHLTTAGAERVAELVREAITGDWQGPGG